MSTKPNTILPPDDDDAGETIQRPTPLDWATLLLGAVRRRKAIAIAALAFALIGVVFYHRSRVPMYRVEAKIIAKRQSVLPGGVRPLVVDDPARSAWELVHRRENLISIVERAKLREAGPSAGPVGGLGLPAVARPKEVPPPGEVLDDLVLALDEALSVSAEEGIITFRVEWGDPQQAYHIVEAALHNYLEARHLLEITEIDEIISVLKRGVAELRQKLDDAIRESLERGAPAEPGALAPAQFQPSAELVELKSMLDARERVISDMEEHRRGRLANLQAQLDQATAVYAENYPGIAILRQEIAALSSEAPHLAALRDEGSRLRKRYAARLAEETRDWQSRRARGPAHAAATALSRDERVRETRQQYQQLLERVYAAELELDAARAAFNHRYEVIWPAQMPREPVSPNTRKIFGVGIIGAILFAFAVAASPDVLTGRIVERWQLERGLNLRVLAVIRRE